jgi:hypothetical protein
MAILVPIGFKDVIATTHEQPLPLWDRVCLLLGFRLRLYVTHYYRERPEEVRTQVVVAVGDWKPLESETATRYGVEEVVSGSMDRFEA